jgi:anti-anti-sigma factor
MENPMSAEQPTVEALQREVAALKVRVAELEQTERELRVYKEITDKAPDGVHLISMDGMVAYSNQAWAGMIGIDHGGVGTSMTELLYPDERDQVPAVLAQLMERGSWHGEWTYQRPDGDPFPGQITMILVNDSKGTPQAIVGIVRDLSEQRKSDAERATLQEQVIEAQRVALREVSTPLIPLAQDVVVMPLVGAIDSQRAQQIMEVLLEGIAQYQADTVLMDISGVRVVDTQVADALLRAARAVQLLGAQIILTGISAEVAQTIVHLGADMGRIMTRANLQDGLRYALEERTR